MRGGATNLGFDQGLCVAISLFPDGPFDRPIDCRAHGQCDKSGAAAQAGADQRGREGEGLGRSEELELSPRQQVDVLLRREVDEGERVAVTTEQQSYLMSRARRNVGVDESKAALRAVQGSYPNLAVDVGPG